MTNAIFTGRRGLLVGGVLFVIGLVLPHVLYPVEAIDIVCFAIFAIAFDLLLGFTGLLSFGQALFWGGSGYASTILMVQNNVPFLAALGFGVVYSFVLSLVVGAISIRRAGIYFAMITLALAQIQYFLAFQLTPLTGGENGLQLSSRGTLFGLSLENDTVYYYLTFAALVITTAVVIRIVSSPFGVVLSAMRDNEQRARGIGYDVERFKLVAFVIAGTLSGFAGSLYAIGNRLVGLDAVDWHTSGKVVMMTILGGIGTIFGPIVGAGFFELLEYYVSKTAIGDKTNVVMGTIFIIVILVARRGIVGEILQRLALRKPRLVQDEDDPNRMVPEPEVVQREAAL